MSLTSRLALVALASSGQAFSAQEVWRDEVNGADRVARAHERPVGEPIGQDGLAEGVAEIPPRWAVQVGYILGVTPRRVHPHTRRDDVAGIEPAARAHVEGQDVAATASVLSFSGRHGGCQSREGENTQDEEAAHGRLSFRRSSATRRASLAVSSSG